MCPGAPDDCLSLAVRQGQFLLRERRPVRPLWTCSCCWRLRRERDGGHLRPGAGVRKSERQEEKAGDNTRALTMDDEMGWGGEGGAQDTITTITPLYSSRSPAYRQKPPMAAIITVWSLTPGVGKNISKGVMRMIHFKVPPSSLIKSDKKQRDFGSQPGCCPRPTIPDF